SRAAQGGVFSSDARTGPERADRLDACERVGGRRGGRALGSPAVSRGAAVLELGMGRAVSVRIVFVAHEWLAGRVMDPGRSAAIGADRPQLDGDPRALPC